MITRFENFLNEDVVGDGADYSITSLGDMFKIDVTNFASWDKDKVSLKIKNMFIE